VLYFSFSYLNTPRLSLQFDTPPFVETGFKLERAAARTGILVIVLISTSVSDLEKFKDSMRAW
jgi:hypothetical protein